MRLSAHPTTQSPLASSDPKSRRHKTARLTQANLLLERLDLLLGLSDGLLVARGLGLGELLHGLGELLGLLGDLLRRLLQLLRLLRLHSNAYPSPCRSHPRNARRVLLISVLRTSGQTFTILTSAGAGSGGSGSLLPIQVVPSLLRYSESSSSCMVGSGGGV